MSSDNSQCDVLDATSLGFSRRVLRDDKYSRVSRLQFTNLEKADELVNELSPNDKFLCLSSGEFTKGLNVIHNEKVVTEAAIKTTYRKYRQRVNQSDNPLFPVAVAGILLALEMGLDLGPAFVGITVSHDVINDSLKLWSVTGLSTMSSAMKVKGLAYDGHTSSAPGHLRSKLFAVGVVEHSSSDMFIPFAGVIALSRIFEDNSNTMKFSWDDVYPGMEEVDFLALENEGKKANRNGDSNANELYKRDFLASCTEKFHVQQHNSMTNRTVNKPPTSELGTAMSYMKVDKNDSRPLLSKLREDFYSTRREQKGSLKGKDSNRAKNGHLSWTITFR